MMGVQAVDVLRREDPASRVIVGRNGTFTDMDIEEALQMERALDEEMYETCTRISNAHRQFGK